MFFTLRINYLLAKIMKHDMSMFVDGFGIQKKKIFTFLTSPQNILFIYNMGENRFIMLRSNTVCRSTEQEEHKYNVNLF